MSDVPAIMPIKFWTDYVPDRESPDGALCAKDWVRWVKKGDQHKSTVDYAIDRLRKMEGRRDDMGNLVPTEWTVVKPFYDAWKAGQAAPVDGTPLEAWAGVTPEQATALRGLNVHSVEDLAGASDSILKRLPFPNAYGMQRNARAYLEAKNRDTSFEKALLSRDEEIAKLKEMIGDLMHRNDEDARERLIADAQPDDAPMIGPDERCAGDDVVERRGPGRPRKVA